MSCKTLKGAMRKAESGDGRKDSESYKELKEVSKKIKKNWEY